MVGFSDLKYVSEAVENFNSVFGPDTVTANKVQFGFLRFRFGNFCVENVEKLMEIVEYDCHAGTISIFQELNIAQKSF